MILRPKIMLLSLLLAPVLCILYRTVGTDAFTTSKNYSMNVARLGTQLQRTTHPPATTPQRILPHGTLLAIPRSFSAAVTLVVASAAGFTMDRKFSPNSGIIVTLCVAAMASNLFKAAPTAHVLYDYCWSVMLPVSFSLLMIHMNAEEYSLASENNISDLFALNLRHMYKVGYSFFWASIGSILGCLLSYRLCTFFPALFSITAVDAAQVTSCLAASFIGGSINFFATAAIIPHLNQSLVTAMAGTDIAVMAIYFAGLSFALNSKPLRRLFSNQYVEGETESTISDTQTKRSGSMIKNRRSTTLVELRRNGLISFLAIILSLSFTGMSKMLERLLEPYVPGTSCGFLAITIPLFMHAAGKAFSPRARNDLRQVAEPLSDLAFLFLFASIGVSVDLRSVAISGPTCLVVALVALFTHSIITLLGSALLIKDCKLEEALVASNAAIGGPATAASFCNQCGAQYALAATVWGVVGYAVGTTVGVTMYRFLVP